MLKKVDLNVSMTSSLAPVSTFLSVKHSEKSRKCLFYFQHHWKLLQLFTPHKSDWYLQSSLACNIIISLMIILQPRILWFHLCVFILSAAPPTVLRPCTSGRRDWGGVSEDLITFLCFFPLVCCTGIVHPVSTLHFALLFPAILWLWSSGRLLHPVVKFTQNNSFLSCFKNEMLPLSI